MSDPITIWIVDDSKSDARRAFAAAQKAIQAARKEGDPEAAILWANDFVWLPVLRESVDLNEPPIPYFAYPEIVVLDLVREGKDGDTLRGDAFYYALRKWEASKPEGKPAMVILWSWHQASRDTEAFVREIKPTDSRLIPLATKQPALLQSKLIKLWARAIEERENS